MSSDEIVGWKSFFSIYPFTQEREDYRIALLCTVISNASGRLKKAVDINTFLPKYLQREAEEKSLEVQAKDWSNFKDKLHSVNKEAGLE